MSDDGNTLAVGAGREDSSGTGVDSMPNEGAANSGAVYLFTRVGTTWASVLPPDPGCLGDLNDDLIVNASDIALLLGAWGTSTYDLTGDNTTNAADLSVLLGAWGECP